MIWISARPTSEIYAPIIFGERRSRTARHIATSLELGIAGSMSGLEMIKATLAILLASVLSTASLATPSRDHHPPTAPTTHEAHEAHEPAHGNSVTPPDDERWPTDEPLRSGMSRIQAAVEQSTTEANLSRERSLALAHTIEQNVTYIIENCKLPPKADAALHGVIARILAAANQLKTDASPDAAVAQVLGALHDYRDAFDHSPAAASHQH